MESKEEQEPGKDPLMELIEEKMKTLTVESFKKAFNEAKTAYRYGLADLDSHLKDDDSLKNTMKDMLQLEVTAFRTIIKMPVKLLRSARINKKLDTTSTTDPLILLKNLLEKTITLGIQDGDHFYSFKYLVLANILGLGTELTRWNFCVSDKKIIIKSQEEAENVVRMTMAVLLHHDDEINVKKFSPFIARAADNPNLFFSRLPREVNLRIATYIARTPSKEIEHLAIENYVGEDEHRNSAG